MATEIKFGTSGWRAIVADEFTLANIRLAIAGIAAYVKTQPEPHRVLVGRDPRFLGEIFRCRSRERSWPAPASRPSSFPDAAPTPAISHAVRALKTSGAINFTASHNPPEYNGIKFSTPRRRARPARSHKADRSRDQCQHRRQNPQRRTARGRVRNCDVKPGFLHRLGELVDLKTIAKSAHQGRLRSLLGSRPRLQLPHPPRSTASKSPPCTTTATSSSAATPPSPTTTCSATAKRR